jgi:hypothetical protein
VQQSQQAAEAIAQLDSQDRRRYRDERDTARAQVHCGLWGVNKFINIIIIMSDSWATQYVVGGYQAVGFWLLNPNLLGPHGQDCWPAMYGYCWVSGDIAMGGMPACARMSATVGVCAIHGCPVLCYAAAGAPGGSLAGRAWLGRGNGGSPGARSSRRCTLPGRTRPVMHPVPALQATLPIHLELLRCKHSHPVRIGARRAAAAELAWSCMGCMGLYRLHGHMLCRSRGCGAAWRNSHVLSGGDPTTGQKWQV